MCKGWAILCVWLCLLLSAAPTFSWAAGGEVGVKTAASETFVFGVNWDVYGNVFEIFAQAVAQLVHTGHYGIYHFTNSGACSRYDWACKILDLSGRGHVPIEPITSDQWQRAASPPLYAPMANFAGAALGINLRPWEDALQEYFGG